MPKVTIWIKNEDMDKWNDIADRPAWLHKHLQGQFNVTYNKVKEILDSGALDEPTYTDMEDVA
jgi:hypothetical protein